MPLRHLKKSAAVPEAGSEPLGVLQSYRSLNTPSGWVVSCGEHLPVNAVGGDQGAFGNQDDWQFVGGHCLLYCTVISSNRAESLVWIACLIGPLALSLLWAFLRKVLDILLSLPDCIVPAGVGALKMPSGYHTYRWRRDRSFTADASSPYCNYDIRLTKPLPLSLFLRCYHLRFVYVSFFLSRLFSSWLIISLLFSLWLFPFAAFGLFSSRLFCPHLFLTVPSFSLLSFRCFQYLFLFSSLLFFSLFSSHLIFSLFVPLFTFCIVFSFLSLLMFFTSLPVPLFASSSFFAMFLLILDQLFSFVSLFSFHLGFFCFTALASSHFFLDSSHLVSSLLICSCLFFLFLFFSLKCYQYSSHSVFSLLLSHLFLSHFTLSFLYSSSLFSHLFTSFYLVFYLVSSCLVSSFLMMFLLTLAYLFSFLLHLIWSLLFLCSHLFSFFLFLSLRCYPTLFLFSSCLISSLFHLLSLKCIQDSSHLV